MPEKKIGRPTDSPKNMKLQIRVDQETLDELDECANVDGSNRSEIIRQGIKLVKEAQKK